MYHMMNMGMLAPAERRMVIGQSLMGLAGPLLQAAGPGPRKTSIGQAIGQGLPGMMAGMQGGLSTVQGMRGMAAKQQQAQGLAQVQGMLSGEAPWAPAMDETGQPTQEFMGAMMQADPAAAFNLVRDQQKAALAAPTKATKPFPAWDAKKKRNVLVTSANFALEPGRYEPEHEDADAAPFTPTVPTLAPEAITGGLDVISEATGALSAVAAWGEDVPILGSIFTGEEERTAKSMMKGLEKDIQTGFAVSSRYPVYEMKQLGGRVPKGGFFSTASAARADLSGLRRDLATKIDGSLADANDSRISEKDRDAARTNYLHGARVLQKIDAFLGEYEGGGGTTISSDAEYDALPSGATYTNAEDGKRRVKP